MSIARIASRYAKSLIDLSVEQNKLERVLKDVEQFQKATKNRDFFVLLKSPIINRGKKAQIFKVLFEEDFDEMTMAYLNIILNKGREAQLAEITAEFVAQYKKIEHVSTVKLTTAKKLDESAVAKIKAQLEASVATDDNIDMETRVDPEIIGGFVIEFDDRLYDASVAHKLEQLRKEFGKNDFIKTL